MGMMYKRGNTWWIKYYRNGKPFFESSKSTKKMVAKRLLDRREGEIAQGKSPGIQYDKTTYRELADDFLSDYEINRKKSLKRAKQSVKNLSRFFEDYRANQITTSKIREYIGMRKAEGRSSATINRELSALKRMLNLGAQQTPPLVERLPHIPMLAERNIRKGFFEHGDFTALKEALPEYLKSFCTFAYKVGWRFDEITGLEWRQVDRQQGIVTLDAGQTKNDDGRTVYLDDELKAVIRNQWDRRKKRATVVPYVFPNANGDGRIKDIRGSFYTACKKAGIGRRLFHDFRRTAVRNMIRAGIPERIAMTISGHKTRSVFDRYNIVNDADLKWASHKQDEYINSLTVTKKVTIGKFGEEKIKSGCRREGQSS